MTSVTDYDCDLIRYYEPKRVSSCPWHMKQRERVSTVGVISYFAYHPFNYTLNRMQFSFLKDLLSKKSVLTCVAVECGEYTTTA